MSDQTTSTIAQLLYVKRPQMNFAHVVSELDAALARCPADRRSLSWDCDDVAIFDLDGARIVLGYSDDLPGQHRACLTVSVGHGVRANFTPPLVRRRSTLCRMIVERISARYPTETIRWHESPQIMSAEQIDRLLDDLPLGETPIPPAVDFDRLMARMDVELSMRQTDPVTELLIQSSPARDDDPVPSFWSALLDTDIATRARSITRPVSRPAAANDPATEPADRVSQVLPARVTPRAPAPAELAESVPVANDRPDLPMEMTSELARLRAALYAEPVAKPVIEQTNQPSNAMRLAIHAMNASLITVYAPMGAAMMTYSILKGEDVRMSGRMMALTGALLALSQSQIGHQMFSMLQAAT